jgi:hypothetical protein
MVHSPIDSKRAEALLEEVLRTHPDVKKADIAKAVKNAEDVEAKELIAKAIDAASPDAAKAGIAEVVKNAEHVEAKELVAKAIDAASPDAAKAGIAKAMQNAEPGEAKELATETMGNLSAESQVEVAEKLGFRPSQETLNIVWTTVVQTFKWVLLLATAGLIGTIVLSIFYSIEPSYIQIMLTVITTIAGSLAGFITGQALSGPRGPSTKI